MEITEHKNSSLIDLAKKVEPLGDKELDQSLGKIKNQTLSQEIPREVSFTGYQETERDLASSKLQQELSSCGIYVSGQINSDRLWGGLNRYSGNLVHDKINEARNANRITDAEYNKLIEMLKKACYYQ